MNKTSTFTARKSGSRYEVVNNVTGEIVVGGLFALASADTLAVGHTRRAAAEAARVASFSDIRRA